MIMNTACMHACTSVHDMVYRQNILTVCMVKLSNNIMQNFFLISGLIY